MFAYQTSSRVAMPAGRVGFVASDSPKQVGIDGSDGAFPCLLQAAAACTQLASCVSLVRECADIAAAGPGPAALLRLLRGCTRSHGALMAAALQVVLPLAKHAAAGAALVAADAMGVLTEKLQIFRDEKVGVCFAGIPPLCHARLLPGDDSFFGL